MNRAATSFGIVLTTAGSEEQAATIARELVERRLAACVNIITQVCSIYRWKGAVHQDEEKILVIKTAEDRFGDVRDAIRELHTYDLPDVVFLPIEKADDDVLGWLENCLSPGGDERPSDESSKDD